MEIKALIFFFLTFIAISSATSNFLTDFDITWGRDKVKVLENGNTLTLAMDSSSGSGFQSKREYLFGRFDIQMKLIPGNSAGTVATLYLSSMGATHDEIDFEFLGNVSGQPYVLHTNIWAKGVGNREQQFYLWFDPRLNYHTYSILWNPQQVVFYVDGTPLRVFRNHEQVGLPYLNKQPMKIYGSLWDGEDWVTRHGLDKTDWKQAPFIVTYRNLNPDACVVARGMSACSPNKANWWVQGLDATAQQKLRWIQQQYMVYDYCKDPQRFPQGLPPECHLPQY